MDAFLDVIPHAFELLRGQTEDCAIQFIAHL
jgi:hypothetical protein